MTDIKTIKIKKQIEDKELKWYVLSVTAWQEELVEQNLKERIKNQNLQEDVVEIWNPKISVVTSKKRKSKANEGEKEERIIKQKKIYPGYLFFKSKMNDKIWYVVRNTPGVRLIVGAETKPIALSNEEYEAIKKQVTESELRVSRTWDETSENKYKIGDIVQVNKEGLKGIPCTIAEIDNENQMVVVSYKSVGQEQTEKCSFYDIE